jgi:hypothetical protein
VKGGEAIGVGAADFVAVNLGHLVIRSRSSGMVILLAGLNSKIRLMIESSSGETGRMDLRNLGSFM